MQQQSYLKHYGILGMKWGVRRYQNPDGTLTQEGKERRNRNSGDDSWFSRARAQISNGLSVHRVNKATRKQTDVGNMTDEEVEKAISRLQLEKRYNDLAKELHPKSSGKLKNAVSTLAADTLRMVGMRTVSEILDRKFESRGSKIAKELAIAKGQYELKDVQAKLADYEDDRKYDRLMRDSELMRANLENKTYKYRIDNYDIAEEVEAQRRRSSKKR